MGDGIFKRAIADGINAVSFYNPDCPNCGSWPESMRPSCACCQPEIMASLEAKPEDVDEAAAKTADPEAFKRGWTEDARKRVAVGAVVRFRRRTPHPESRP